MTDRGCQVCGGPIANGRCRLCGMPVRRDEVLYHLNENKEEHARHATPKAREILKEREIPLADRRKPKHTQTLGAKPKSETFVHNAKNRSLGKKANPAGKKNNSAALKLTLLILVISVIVSLVSDMGLFSRTENNPEEWQTVREVYELTVGTPLIVGEDLPVGVYTVRLKGGTATLSLIYDDTVENWEFGSGHREMELGVAEGMALSLSDADIAGRTLELELGLARR